MVYRRFAIEIRRDAIRFLACRVAMLEDAPLRSRVRHGGPALAAGTSALDAK
jgi:hypothetical protein